MRFILQTHNHEFRIHVLRQREIFFLFFFPSIRSLNPFTAFRMIHKLRMWELEGSWERQTPAPHFTNEENLINSFVQGPTPNSGGLRTKTDVLIPRKYRLCFQLGKKWYASIIWNWDVLKSFWVPFSSLRWMCNCLRHHLLFCQRFNKLLSGKPVLI